jgi:hypothetical protein
MFLDNFFVGLDEKIFRENFFENISTKIFANCFVNFFRNIFFANTFRNVFRPKLTSIICLKGFFEGVNLQKKSL